MPGLDLDVNERLWCNSIGLMILLNDQLVLIGLGARWAALYIICNVSVAGAFVHHFQFFARGAPGEVMGLYIAGFLAIAIMGPGRFSLDHRLRIGWFR